MKFNVSYRTDFPLEEKSPIAWFESENKTEELLVEFINTNNDELLVSNIIKSGEKAYGIRQWYTNWLVRFKNLNGEILHSDYFDPTRKVVFIKIDAHALGDNLAWVPYVEEYRVRHNCTVICSTFWNHLFQDVYKNILFVAPDTKIMNVYTQYYIGTLDTLNNSYFPSTHTEKPLQKVASDILGLDYREVKPKIDLSYAKKINCRKFVCISEKASSPIKEWKGGWQEVVNYLNSIGYDVVVISKEPTTLENVINMTGNIPLNGRVKDLVNCDFFMGVSSGLSWLSWACGAHTFLISDYTPPYHEFNENCTRIYSENCVKKIVLEENLNSIITSEMVINKIKAYLSSKS